MYVPPTWPALALAPHARACCPPPAVLARLMGAGPAPVLQAQADALERISSAAAKAAQLNESVYNERIPSFEALAPIVPKPIVKTMSLHELHPDERPGQPTGASRGGRADGRGWRAAARDRVCAAPRLCLQSHATGRI